MSDALEQRIRVLENKLDTLVEAVELLTKTVEVINECANSRMLRIEGRLDNLELGKSLGGK